MELYINTPGAYLHVKDDLFAIQTKVEGKEVIQHIAAHKLRTIVIATHAALSTDAVRLALMNNVDIVFLKSDGHPLGRVWHSKMGSTTKIRKQQLVVSLNAKGLEWTKTWLSNKLNNQIEHLKNLRKHRTETYGELIDQKCSSINDMRQAIAALAGNNTNQIADSARGYEGTAGRYYWETLSTLLAEQYKFDGRSMRPAKDQFNAFLNYAYGILYSKIEKVLIIAGIDPYVGFMHRDDYNQKSMVFDFIEPYRIYAERVVFKLFAAKKVNKAHTTQITNGLSLNKEGKILLVEAFTEHLETETIRYKGKNQTRFNAMQFDAHNFAQQLLTEEVEIV